MGNQKGNILNILIIDDDTSYVKDALQMKARPHRIKLEHYTNLDEAESFLSSNKGKYIGGVILDVLCLKTKDQEIPDNSFITKAISYFDKNYPNLPKVVLTGEPDQYKNLKDLYQDTCEVFDKSTGEEALLKHLKEESLQLEHIMFANTFPDVFEIFEKGYLDAQTFDDLNKCIKEMRLSDKTVLKRNLGTLRNIQEVVYQTLNKKDPNIVSTANISNGTKTRAIMREFFNNKYTEQNGIINQFSWPIYIISSEFGSHSTMQSPDYLPTIYTVQSLVWSLFDILLWFKEIMDQD